MACPFKFPNVLATPLQQNFEALAGLSPFFPPGGSTQNNFSYATATIATEETTTSSVWIDLATAGPSVTVDIPQYAFVFFIATVRMWGLAAGYRVWDVTGNFDLRRGDNNGFARSPGTSSSSTKLEHALSARGNQEVQLGDGGSGAQNQAIVTYFNEGVALTDEEFTLQYRRNAASGIAASFADRALTVVVVTPTNV